MPRFSLMPSIFNKDVWDQTYHSSFVTTTSSNASTNTRQLTIMPTKMSVKKYFDEPSVNKHNSS